MNRSKRVTRSPRERYILELMTAPELELKIIPGRGVRIGSARTSQALVNRLWQAGLIEAAGDYRFKITPAGRQAITSPV